MDEPTNPPRELNIKIDDDQLRGAYANLLRITHTAEEFILDFINMAPPQGVVTARVVTSPSHVKRIIRALEANVKRFEQAHGSIRDLPGGESEVN